MTDFQELMAKEPRFKLTDKSLGMSKYTKCKIYRFAYDGEYYYITNYDFITGSGDDLFEKESKAIVVSVDYKVYGYVSRDLLIGFINDVSHDIDLFNNFMTVLKNRLTK